MTQQDKDLLLRDLSARLTYKVIAQVSYKDREGWKTEDRKVLGAYTYEQVYADCVYTDIENVKPYLRPMSSMTEEERKEKLSFFQIVELNSGLTPLLSALKSFEYINWLNAHHFDYRGLIEKGLALEAPEGMY